jgi:O-antigen/teichoic acid export membrane protein
MLKRIFKMLLAQGTNVFFVLLTQLVLPPIFIHVYGVARYGEWLVLFATISYLTALNFGLTTYTSNELTMLKQRGDLERYRSLQASTLVLLLCVVAIGVVALAAVAALPLGALLHFTRVGETEARLTAFFLGLQMMVYIISSYYCGLFMVVQQTHRGQMWMNWRVIAPTLATIPLALYHTSFATIALGQFVLVSLFAVATFIDLTRRMEGLPLGFKGASWVTAKAALKPSGMFAMVFTQQFLIFQVPVIILQRLLGPEIVVLFSISRTIFSMARRVLSMITNAIAPEITFSFGDRNLKKLLDIFHYSERVVFSLIPVLNLGTFLLSPLLLRIWLHRPGLFDLWTYALMALISGVMSMREHKQFFQFSTNTHRRLAHIVFWGNLIMIAVSIPMTHTFGIRGFMVTWLVSEATQMALLYLENKQLFESDPSITMIPVLKLAGLMTVGLPLFMALIQRTLLLPRIEQGAVGIAGSLAVFFVAYWLFGLNLVQQRLLKRFSARRNMGTAA